MKLSNLQSGRLYKLVPAYWSSATNTSWGCCSGAVDLNGEFEAHNRPVNDCRFGTLALCLSIKPVRGNGHYDQIDLFPFLIEDQVVLFPYYVVTDGMIEAR